MNRRSFFGLIAVLFGTPFLPRLARPEPLFIGQNQIVDPGPQHQILPEQVQMQMAPEKQRKWPGQESGNLWISPYQNQGIKPINTGTWANQST